MTAPAGAGPTPSGVLAINVRRDPEDPAAKGTTSSGLETLEAVEGAPPDLLDDVLGVDALSEPTVQPKARPGVKRWCETRIEFRETRFAPLAGF